MNANLQKPSFDNLVEQYGQQVLNTALRILGDPQGAMDVHQEVFLAVLKRWPRYRNDVKWSHYLYRVTIRQALRQAKANRKARSIAGVTQEPAAKDRPETSLIAQEMRQKLMACLHRLPARQAEVFVLHRLEGLTYQAIAEILSCSESTVRVHAYRSLKSLAVWMKDYRE